MYWTMAVSSDASAAFNCSITFASPCIELPSDLYFANGRALWLWSRAQGPVSNCTIGLKLSHESFLGRARLQPCRPEPIKTRALDPEGLGGLLLRFTMRSLPSEHFRRDPLQVCAPATE